MCVNCKDKGGGGGGGWEIHHLFCSGAKIIIKKGIIIMQSWFDIETKEKRFKRERKKAARPRGPGGL